MTMSRWHLDFFTSPETNAIVQWHIHVKVNKKVCSTTTAVHDFSQLLLMWITSLTSSVRVAGSLA